MTVATPANPRPDPDEDLRRAVALAYRAVRQRSELDHPAWLAARDVALELRPEMSEEEAGRRVTQIIAWASREHTAWFWAGVGERRDACRGRPWPDDAKPCRAVKTSEFRDLPRCRGRPAGRKDFRRGNRPTPTALPLTG